ncbi:MAG: hypothetical protein PVI97_10270 [Candidatus Thiodiazotropha sp.]|jgi:hypothetical protein
MPSRLAVGDVERSYEGGPGSPGIKRGLSPIPMDGSGSSAS